MAPGDGGQGCEGDPVDLVTTQQAPINYVPAGKALCYMQIKGTLRVSFIYACRLIVLICTVIYRAIRLPVDSRNIGSVRT